MPQSTSVFDEKIFNGQVFKGYVDRVPNTKRSELIKSKAIRPRPDLASAMADQTGGNYITTTLRGLISGSAPANYDGTTNMPKNGTVTFRHSRVVVGRMNSWTENDFSYDITGGEDFMENIAQQVSEYWGEIDQDTLVCILKGIFNMTGAANKMFVDKHTYDVCDIENAEGKVGYLDATTINTGMQRACGDNKGKFTLAIMHSVVATNLENLKILVYLKFNDANGIEREIGIGTINGRLVLVDDGMPVEEVAAGEDGAAAYNKYTTFVLGDGAIEYTDCGAKVPYEVDRDPDTNGGQDTLYSRQRKCFAPYGISFTQANMATLSPTNTELEDGSNWELVSTKGAKAKQYIDHKAIPIARVISRG